MPDTVGPPDRRSVAAAMITGVKLSGVGTTVGDLRELFCDEHVHAAVIVDRGTLLTVVDRADVHGTHPDGIAAVTLGRCAGRTVRPDLDLEAARDLMLRSARRRLAVVGSDGTFLGLLCLKRSRLGFCSDDDVRARARDLRARTLVAP